jgi:ABC-2 type transport system permease protein
MFAAQIRYQITLMLRTPRAFMLSLVFPALLLALQSGRHRTGVPITVVAGLVVLGTMSVAYVTYASGLVAAREEGILRRWRVTPLPSGMYFAGRIAATILLADAAGVVLILVAAEMDGLHLTVVTIGGLLLADTLGALALAAAGTAVCRLITTAAGANPILMLTYLPVLIFSGGLGAISGLPHWLTTVMSYLPITPIIDSITTALHHTGTVVTPRNLAVLLAWTAVCLLLSLRFFRWDPTRPRHARLARRGHPVEYPLRLGVGGLDLTQWHECHPRPRYRVLSERETVHGQRVDVHPQRRLERVDEPEPDPPERGLVPVRTLLPRIEGLPAGRAPPGPDPVEHACDLDEDLFIAGHLKLDLLHDDRRPLQRRGREPAHQVGQPLEPPDDERDVRGPSSHPLRQALLGGLRDRRIHVRPQRHRLHVQPEPQRQKDPLRRRDRDAGEPTVLELGDHPRADTGLFSQFASQDELLITSLTNDLANTKRCRRVHTQ